MSIAATIKKSPPMPGAPLARFSAARYEELTRHGIFGPEDRIELIDGYLVEKMPQNDPHSYLIDLLTEILIRDLPPNWTARFQLPVRLSSDSIPEPDAVVVPSPKSLYQRRKPGRKDIALVIEVADSSLRYERTTKQRVYARNRIPMYWIVNIPAQTVEVYSEPKVGREPSYRNREDFTRGTRVPIILLGEKAGEIAVDDLFRVS